MMGLMINAAIIWTFAGVLAAACFARGHKMRDEKRALAELVWHTAGAFFLVSGALLWVSLEAEILWQHRLILVVSGSIFGALGALSLGEFVHQSRAQTPPTASVPSVGNNNTVVGVPPPANMGSGNTFVGPTDTQGNTIINRGGTAIGAGACADQTGVAIGAGANAGGCAPKKQ
jgi:hypothetical protein